MQSVTLRCGSSVIVDECDAALFDLYTWYVRPAAGKNKSYVVRVDVVGRRKYRTIYLHRSIASAQDGDIVDHINGDTMDNRRENLRIVSATQNATNQKKKRTNSLGGECSSAFKGVFLDKKVKKNPWRAAIRGPNGERIHLGMHPTQEAAALAYDRASLELHGEHGLRNFA